MQAAQDNDLSSLGVLAPPRELYTRLPPGAVRGSTGLLCRCADLILLTGVLVLLGLSAGGISPKDSVIDLLEMKLSVEHFVVLTMCWIAWRTTFSYCGLYNQQQVRSLEGLVGRLVLATGLSAVIAGAVISASWHHRHFWRNTLFFWMAANSSILSLRIGVAVFELYIRPHFRKVRNVVIVGTGPRAERANRELTSHPEWNYKLLGFVDSRPLTTGKPELVLGRISDLEDILMRQVVDEVVITLSTRSQYLEIEETIAICERVGVQLQYCEELFETSIAKRVCTEGDEYPRVVLKMVHDDYRQHLKRAFDIVGALCGLVLLSPLLLAVALLIKFTSEGPVLFRQERYGLSKRTFFIYKFRSMVINAEAGQAALEHMNQNSGPVFKIFADPRVTKVGAILRKTSIDELPQLFNVLRGDMSLVGPRPLNKRDVSRFSEPWLMRRFSVKPGLTCLWQVSGRSNVSFDRWIALDLHYIDHWSLLLDLKILAMTFPAVLRGKGAA
jgi:exopolysaccharide biosynthesis polyprenyl glycosylphosphotransferase